MTHCKQCMIDETLRSPAPLIHECRPSLTGLWCAYCAADLTPGDCTCECDEARHRRGQEPLRPLSSAKFILKEEG